MLQLSLLLPQDGLGGAPAPDYRGYMLVCAGLLLALGLLAYGFRRLCGGALKRRAAQRSMAVLDVLPLGGRQRLAVVRCYDRTFILGLAEKAISLVAEIEREEGEFELAPRTAETFGGELERAGAPVPAAPVSAAPVSAAPARKAPAPKAPAPKAAAAEGAPRPAVRPRTSAAELVARMREEGVLG